jgi:hypothetical protein
MASLNKPRTRNTKAASLASQQIAIHPVLKADIAVGRIAARLTVEFYLRTTIVVSKLSGGDPVEALILRAIIAGNTNHLDRDPQNPGRFASIDDIPPDELRRPVSVLAVASSLGLPYETTRRCANKLLKSGQCVRVKGGLIAPGARHQRPEDDEAILANMVNLRHFFSALTFAGVKLTD